MLTKLLHKQKMMDEWMVRLYDTAANVDAKATAT